MNLTRMAVTVGLACVAANLLMKGRRGEASDADDGLEPFPSVDAGLPARIAALTTGRSVASDDGTADTGVPGSGADSPNDAERLQASGVAADSDDDSWTRDLFKSTSQDSPYARAPGLPDFARGA
jgi:hypothetical protein